MASAEIFVCSSSFSWSNHSRLVQGRHPQLVDNTPSNGEQSLPVKFVRFYTILDSTCRHSSQLNAGLRKTTCSTQGGVVSKSQSIYARYLITKHKAAKNNEQIKLFSFK